MYLPLSVMPSRTIPSVMCLRTTAFTSSSACGCRGTLKHLRCNQNFVLFFFQFPELLQIFQRKRFQRSASLPKTVIGTVQIGRAMNLLGIDKFLCHSECRRCLNHKSEMKKLNYRMAMAFFQPVRLHATKKHPPCFPFFRYSP